MSFPDTKSSSRLIPLFMEPQIGQSAKTGRFTTVQYAKAHKATAIVRTIPVPPKRK